ncbi:MAG: uncharacterized protein PWR01_2250 [Clostridiales bacterium]|jgi:radical SAM protein (TIGR01212 family)|nr:uncharacterized protein [Clostridiales bacterium]MDN5281177.1 uncharacterized protein [Candidatus Ozemobacter sp.]
MQACPVNFYKPADGKRLQKIPVDAGFSCPNRDGTLSFSGCAYCANQSFSPFYCSAVKSVEQQLQEGMAFFSSRYKCSGFYAYFQSYSATHDSLEYLENLYEKTLKMPGIEGLVIATRPDCLNPEKIELMKRLREKTFIRVEVGIESCNDNILQAINRCHDFSTALEAIKGLTNAGIETCGHLIFGLPGETQQDRRTAAQLLSGSGLSLLKLHHLQIIKGSKFARDFIEAPEKFELFSADDYLIALGDFLTYLSDKIAIERLINRVPPRFLIAPIWGGLSESSLRSQLIAYMQKNGIFQSCEQ